MNLGLRPTDVNVGRAVNHGVDSLRSHFDRAAVEQITMVKSERETAQCGLVGTTADENTNLMPALKKFPSNVIAYESGGTGYEYIHKSLPCEG